MRRFDVRIFAARVFFFAFVIYDDGSNRGCEIYDDGSVPIVNPWVEDVSNCYYSYHAKYAEVGSIVCRDDLPLDECEEGYEGTKDPEHCRARIDGDCKEMLQTVPTNRLGECIAR